MERDREIWQSDKIINKQKTEQTENNLKFLYDKTIFVQSYMIIIMTKEKSHSVSGETWDWVTEWGKDKQITRGVSLIKIIFNIWFIMLQLEKLSLTWGIRYNTKMSSLYISKPVNGHLGFEESLKFSGH